jgi:ribosomal protein S18 acetylase RimI-like enzyme
VDVPDYTSTLIPEDLRYNNVLKAVSAANYSIEALTAIYNETRMDYIVPMPMNAKRLAEYIHVYSCDLSASCVILDGTNPCGLGILGVRPNRAWVTRLGVVAEKRKAGAGKLIMDYLIHAAEERGIQAVWLEVIQGNKPARKMFDKYGFQQTRELLVIRRPPNFVSDEVAEIDASIQEIQPLEKGVALDLLRGRRERSNWLNQTETMENAGNLAALKITCQNGQTGWASFDVGRFQLSRIVVTVTNGDPVMVTAALLRAIHRHFPTKDTVIENISADDPKWPGFQKLGYFDSFRRVEMIRQSK